MNDLGLGDTILDSAQEVNQKLGTNEKDGSHHDSPRTSAEENLKLDEYINGQDVGHELHTKHKHSRHHYKKSSHADETALNEQESSIYQSTTWWFTSTAFPLFAGTFGPIANLLSVCALVESWRVHIDDGSRISDPHWLTGLNATSLFLALVANVVLMFNFARRIRYALAQPITITLWYLSSILLIICLCIIHTIDPHIDIKQLEYSQSYYYGLISCVLYFSISTLLLISSLGSVVFHAYPPSFAVLTGPQRTLMLQTTTFSLYLALGAGVFAQIENWSFTNGVYWADYTLLTIGLGSDFPLNTVLGRMLLIPYAAVGITFIGLVVSSVRGLVLERARAKVARRHLEKEREKWSNNINERRRAALLMSERTATQESTMSSGLSYNAYREKWKQQQLMRLPSQLKKHAAVQLKHEDQKGPWHRAEFELMRLIQHTSENRMPYEALFTSFLIIMVVWIGGTLIFWSCEHKIQGWTYPDAFYFSYTSLLTIGYGDFYPSSSAGKPFFVVWSLISVPAMTVFISNMGDTVIKWLKEMTIWVSQWTILPEKKLDPVEEKQSVDRPRHKRRVSNGDIVNGRDDAVNTSHGPPSSTKSSHSLHHRKSKAKQSTDRPSEVFESDVEHLGARVEGFEKSEGREGSLAARLSREISRVAKDLRESPPKKYSWEQWSIWLTMLGERDNEEFAHLAPFRDKIHPSPKGAPVEIITVPPGKGLQGRPTSTPVPEAGTVSNVDDTSHESEGIADPVIPHGNGATSPTPLGDINHADAAGPGDLRPNSVIDADWRWTWLGDHGPLFSQLTETQWVIEKLCFRLEEVLEDEIKEAHALADECNRKPVK